VNRFPESSKNITLKLSDFVNIGKFVIVGADVPVPPFGIGNVFAGQCILLSFIY
tara:strand:- start:1134 stop:1295 length:162 start_codon:yes stop_codon:yes gene_type:complete